MSGGDLQQHTASKSATTVRRTSCQASTVGDNNDIEKTAVPGISTPHVQTRCVAGT